MQLPALMFVGLATMATAAAAATAATAAIPLATLSSSGKRWNANPVSSYRSGLRHQAFGMMALPSQVASYRFGEAWNANPVASYRSGLLSDLAPAPAKFSQRDGPRSYTVGLRWAANPVDSYRVGLWREVGAVVTTVAAPPAAAATPASYSFGLRWQANPVESYRTGLLSAHGLGNGGRRVRAARVDSAVWGQRYTANPIDSYRAGLHRQLAPAVEGVAAATRRSGTVGIASAQWGAQYTANAVPSYRAGLAARIALALVSIEAGGFFGDIVVDARSNHTANASVDDLEISLLPGIVSYQHGSRYTANDSPSYRAGLGHEMASLLVAQSA